MNSMLLDSGNALYTTLSIVMLIVFGVFVAISLFAGIWNFVLIRRYNKFNKQEVSTGLTGAGTARELLKGLGIDNVEVVKCNFFSAFFLGNSYSPFKKRIRLRKNIYDKKSLTAIALATQKVAIAQRDIQGDKKIKTRSVFMTLGYFSPFAVLPLVILGILIDIFVMKGLGVFTIVFSAIALVWYCSSFIVLLLNIPIEKKACQTAEEFIQKTNLVSEEEIEDVKELYKTYITKYILDFVVQILYILWRILKVFLRGMSKK